MPTLMVSAAKAGRDRSPEAAMAAQAALSAKRRFIKRISRGVSNGADDDSPAGGSVSKGYAMVLRSGLRIDPAPRWPRAAQPGRPTRRTMLGSAPHQSGWTGARAAARVPAAL